MAFLMGYFIEIRKKEQEICHQNQNKNHRWPYIGEGRYFSKPKKVENWNYIRPWPYTHYKAMGGLISDIRPWPYMRGNTVRFYLY